MYKCPGQTGKRLDEMVSYEACPKCEGEIEFFYDDVARKCSNCEAVVVKSPEGVLKDFRCAKWCKSAEQCLGTEVYRGIKTLLDK